MILMRHFNDFYEHPYVFLVKISNTEPQQLISFFDFRIIGAAGLSSLYSWSLSNIEISKAGFQFNQYLVFLVISFICVCNAAHVKYFIPQSLDRGPN